MWGTIKVLAARRQTTLLCSAVAAYLWWYYRFAVKSAELTYQDSTLSQHVLRRCWRLLHAYWPSLWAVNPNLQTVLSILRKHTINARYSRQLLRSPDGGTIGLDWFRESQNSQHIPADAPVLLVLHGLAGSSEDGMAKWLAAAAAGRGWRAAVLNYRGSGGVPLTSPAVTSAASTGDVALALDAISHQFPQAPLLAAGFSMGGLILTKFLGELGMGRWSPALGARLRGAAVVSSPFCPAASNARLSRRWSMPWVFNVALTRLFLRRFCAEHAVALAARPDLDLPALMRASTMDAFVEGVICKLAAHASSAHYYAISAAHRHIPAIRTPTLLLVSADDPFLGRLPTAEAAANPATMLAVTARGGHCGFLSGLWPFGRAWLDDVVTDFLGCLLEDDAPTPAGQHAGAYSGVSASVAVRGRGGGAKSRSIADFTRWHAKEEQRAGRGLPTWRIGTSWASKQTALPARPCTDTAPTTFLTTRRSLSASILPIQSGSKA